MQIIVQDFTGVYSEQPFMQGLRDSARRLEQGAKLEGAEQIRWLDCTQIAGTDCYCDDEAVAEINKLIDESLCCDCGTESATPPAIHFFDNGNYHYMSKLWTDRIQEPFDLVVFDHHPDMQPPRFGDILSCGGWVKKVLEENKFVRNTILIGVADHLVEELQEDFASLGDRAMRLTIVKESELSSFNPRTLSPEPRTSSLYLSIDKDVLSPADAATNWDQGSLTFETMTAIISDLARNRKILGVDICGERAQEFKPIENGAQTAQEADELNNKLNQELVDFLAGSRRL
ncbi:arginase family protein [Fibrobacter sp.]|uniref:arginase family protein n=1 Tax=Fibrobacter sp. TaxID=35828 RepID=UPI00388EF8CD